MKIIVEIMQTFEVWNPNEGMVANQLPQMCQHIGKIITILKLILVSLKLALL